MKKLSLLFICVLSVLLFCVSCNKNIKDPSDDDGNGTLTLEQAFEEATIQFQQHPEIHRNPGEFQSETQEILLLNGKYYQSYISSASGLRYIFIHNTEYSMSADWDWIPIGTKNTYSLELLGKIDEGYE